MCENCKNNCDCHKEKNIPEIIVHVSGGLVQGVDIPKNVNVQVVVKDYDKSDYITEDELADMKEDENGKYHECVY